MRNCMLGNIKLEVVGMYGSKVLITEEKVADLS